MLRIIHSYQIVKKTLLDLRGAILQKQESSLFNAF